jgi:hypothetical protein
MHAWRDRHASKVCKYQIYRYEEPLGFLASLLPHLTQQELLFGFILALPSKLTHPSKDILAHPGEPMWLSRLGKICSS